MVRGSASEACNLEPPTFGVAVLRTFTPPTTNFIGDRRSPEKVGVFFNLAPIKVGPE